MDSSSDSGSNGSQTTLRYHTFLEISIPVPDEVSDVSATSNGGYCELPRDTVTGLKDFIGSVEKTLTNFMDSAGHVHVTSINGPNPLSRITTEEILNDDIKIPPCALKHKTTVMTRIMNGIIPQGVNGKRILRQSYHVAGEGSQSKDHNWMSCKRPNALQKFKDSLLPYAPRIETLGELYQAQETLLDSIVGAPEPGEKYENFEKRLIKVQSQNPQPKVQTYLTREVTTTRSRWEFNSKIAERIRKRETKINNRSPIRFVDDICAGVVTPKFEKRNSEPRNTSLTPIPYMCRQFSGEECCAEIRNLKYCTNGKTNNSIVINAEQGLCSNAARATHKLSHGKVLPPTMINGSWDDTQYNSTITWREFLVFLFITGVTQSWEVKSSFLMLVYLLRFRSSRLETVLRRDGIAYKVPAVSISIQVIAQLKFLQKWGEEAYTQLLINSRKKLPKAQKVKGQKYTCTKLELIQDGHPVLFKNPDRLYTFGAMFSWIQSPEGLTEGNRMGMGNFNMLANASQSQDLEMTYNAMEQFGSAVFKLYDIFNPDFSDQINPLQVFRTQVRQGDLACGQFSLAGLTPMQYLELPSGYRHARNPRIYHGVRGQRDHLDIRVKNKTRPEQFLDIHPRNMLFNLIKNVLKPEIIPLYINEYQKSDDSLTLMGCFGNYTIVLKRVVMGSHGKRNRKISTKKSTYTWENNATLFSQPFNQDRFIRPITSMKRAMLPSGVAMASDLNSMLATCLEFRVFATEAFLIMMAWIGVERHRYMYRMWPPTHLSYDIGEATHQIQKIYSCFQVDGRTFHDMPASIGGNIIFSTLYTGTNNTVLEMDLKKDTNLMYMKDIPEFQDIITSYRGVYDTALTEAYRVDGMTNFRFIANMREHGTLGATNVFLQAIIPRATEVWKMKGSLGLAFPEMVKTIELPQAQKLGDLLTQVFTRAKVEGYEYVERNNPE